MLNLKPGSFDLVVLEAGVRVALPGAEAEAVEGQSLDPLGDAPVVAAPRLRLS